MQDKQQFELALDGVEDEDEYLSEEFEKPPQKTDQFWQDVKQRINIEQQKQVQAQADNSHSQQDNNNSSNRIQMVTKAYKAQQLPASKAAAPVAVSPDRQQQQQPPPRSNMVIGNLEYGMRANSPNKTPSRSNRRSNDFTSGAAMKKPPTRPNNDLQDVVPQRKKKTGTGTGSSMLVRSSQEQGSNYHQQQTSSNQRKTSSKQQTRNNSGSQQNNSRSGTSTAGKGGVGQGLDRTNNEKPFSRQTRNSQPNSAYQDKESETLPQVRNRSSLNMPEISQANKTAVFNKGKRESFGADSLNKTAKLVQDEKQSLINNKHKEGLSQQYEDVSSTVQEPRIMNKRSQKQNFVQKAAKYYEQQQQQSSISAKNHSPTPEVSIKNQQSRAQSKAAIAQSEQRSQSMGGEMPHIYMQKNLEGRIQEISSLNQTYQNNELISTKKEKPTLVGLPYRVKTQLPFYDGRSVYQGVKVSTNLSVSDQKRQQLLRQQNDNSVQINSSSVHYQINHSKKSRSIGQNIMHKTHQSQQSHNQSETGPSAQISISPRITVNPFTNAANSKNHQRNQDNKLDRSGFLSEIGANTQGQLTQNAVDQSRQSYVINSNNNNKRGLSEFSSGSKGGAVAPPTLNNFRLKNNELRQSVVSDQVQSILKKDVESRKNTRGPSSGLLTNYKMVQEVPFIESVDNVVDNYRSSIKKQKQSLSPSQKTIEKNTHGSRLSLLGNSAAECGIHADIIKAQKSQIDQLKDELRIKDRLVQKLLDDEEDEDNDKKDNVTLQKYMISQEQQQKGSSPLAKSKSSNNFVLKLKSELDLAYKILAQRDSEIVTLKSKSNVMVLNKCNEERIQYMNECMKLQSLLKIYGGKTLRNQFKGVKIVQTATSNEPSSKIGQRVASLGATSIQNQQMDKTFQQRSPTAKNYNNANNTDYVSIDKILAAQSDYPKKPKTSIQIGKNIDKDIGKIFPILSIEEKSHGDGVEGDGSTIEELQQKVKHLETMNQQLLQDRVESEKELNLQVDTIDRQRFEMRTLEQNLVEKADLARSLQILSDDRSMENKKLMQEYQELQVKLNEIKHIHKVTIKGSLVEIEALKLQLQNFQPEEAKSGEVKGLSSSRKTPAPQDLHTKAMKDKESKLKELQKQLDSKELLEKELRKQLEEKELKAKELLSTIAKKDKTIALKQKSVTQKDTELNLMKIKLKQTPQSPQKKNIKGSPAVVQEQSSKQELDSANQQIMILSSRNEQISEEKEKEAQAIKMLNQQLQAKIDDNKNLEEQLKHLNAQKENDIIKESKQAELKKSHRQEPMSDNAFEDQLIELEMQNGDLEMQVQDLERQVKKLNDQLTLANAGKIVVENLQDKTNFANLISRQGTLVENLNIEKKRAQELEQIVIEQSEMQVINQELNLQSSRTKRGIEASTQTTHRDIPISSQVIMEQTEGNQTDDYSPINRKILTSGEQSFALQLDGQDDDQESTDVNLAPGDTIASVQLDIKDAQLNKDKKELANLRVKESLLLTQQIKTLQDSLVKKNELINITLESQEKLAESQVVQKKLIQEKQAEIERLIIASNGNHDESGQQKSDENGKLQKLQERARKLSQEIIDKDNLIQELQDEKEQVEELSQNRLQGLKDVLKMILQEQFAVYKVSNEECLTDMLEEEPEQVLETQFMIPYSAFLLLESSPKEVFEMMDKNLLYDVSMTELEIGFRKMKQVLDNKNMDYKVLIFDIETKNANDTDKDLHEVRIEIAKETIDAIPLMRDEFVEKINDNILEDLDLSERIAQGCQQVARSICFVHFWAFNSLWIKFNQSNQGGKKLTMKQILLQADKDKEANQQTIAKMEKQQQKEAERAKKYIIAQQLEAEKIQKQTEQEAEKIRKQAQIESEKMRKEAQEEFERVQNEMALEAKRVKQLMEDEKERARKQLEDEAQRNKQQMKRQQEEAKIREQELAEAARIREQELLDLKQPLPNANDPAEGENGDREGFSLECYRFIKRNNDLSVIVNIANASLYSIRNQCNVFSIEKKRLSDGRTFSLDDDAPEPPFTSMTVERDNDGLPIIDFADTDQNEEVIYRSDFYGKVLMGMGLKRYIDLSEETAKLDKCLTQIGAMATDLEALQSTKFIRLEVLISAMRIHKYEYAGMNLATKLPGIDLRMLTPKSMRIMNRLTRIVAQYQDKYQQKAEEGVRVTFQQIVQAIFKGQIETRMIQKSANLNASIDEKMSQGLNTSMGSAGPNEIKLQLIADSKFYLTLLKLKIKKNSLDVRNLSRFLRLNEQNPDQIIVKKLVKVVEEFLRNHYLKSFGFNKKRLDAKMRESQDNNTKFDYGVEEKDEEYYYYEEDPLATASKPSPQQNRVENFLGNVQNHLTKINKPSPTIEYGNEDEYYYDEEVPNKEPSQQQHQPIPIPESPVPRNIPLKLHQQQQQQMPLPHEAVQLDEGEYEYYDEEDDGAEKPLVAQTIGKQQPTNDYKPIPQMNKLGTKQLSTGQATRYNPISQQIDNQSDGVNLGMSAHGQYDAPPKHRNATNSMATLPARASVMSAYDAGTSGQQMAPSNSIGYNGEPEADSKYNGLNEFQLENDDYEDDNDWL